MGSESFAANYANYANRRVKDSLDAPVRVVRVIEHIFQRDLRLDGQC